MEIKYFSGVDSLDISNGKERVVINGKEIDNLLSILGRERRDVYTELIGDTLGMSNYCIGKVDKLPEACNKVGLAVTLHHLKCLDEWHRLNDDYRVRLRRDIEYMEMLASGKIEEESVPLDDNTALETEEQLKAALVFYISGEEKQIFAINGDGSRKLIDVTYVKESKILKAFRGYSAEIVFTILDKLVEEDKIIQLKYADVEKTVIDGEIFTSGGSPFQFIHYKIKR
jgi:hypothetical protein